MPLELAVIGQTGQLSRALARVTALRGHDATFYNRFECDLSHSSENIALFLESLPPVDAIILAAAYTAVDLAETEHELAYKINAEAPGALAEFCVRKNIPLVHISTDYVFDGQATAPYKPDHPTKPVNHYGATKLAGESKILESGCQAAILRTSWVFDGTGKNFMTTMLRLAETRTELNVVGDQIGRPTYAGHLAEACLVAAEYLCTNKPGSTGIFHVSGAGEPVSWAGFAKAIFEFAGTHIPHKMTIHAIPTSEYPTPAARPAYSVLDITDFERIFEYKLPIWTKGLEVALTDCAQSKTGA